MHKFKYALFYDFHTSTTNPDVGKGFDIEAFTDQVQACGVDFLTWHARCNQGNAYFNTQEGERHPALEYDMIRQLGDACHRKGIKLSVYFNGSMSDEEFIKHRDWMCILKTGHIWHGGDSPAGFSGPWARMACYNSPYRDHIQKMVNELLDNDYPIDGFFFDCLQEMAEKGIDYRDPAQLKEFAHFSVHRFSTELYDLIRAKKPDAFLFYNGRPFEEVIGMESHLECECLPTAAQWGYETLPMCAHYMRTVAGPDRSVLNMTGRFNDWGDFGGLRTEEGLKFDMLYGVANGMRPDIGGHFHPRGDLDLPVFERIRSVYQYLQQFDPWVLDAENKPEIALVYPRHGKYYPKSPAATAAVRMLTELKIQFDFVSDFVPWDQYKLLIFPDDAEFTEEVAARVEKHLARGGKVLATSRSGLDPEGKQFALKSWPVEYVGKNEMEPIYFMPAGELAEGISPMPLSVYAGGVDTRLKPGVSADMFIVKPYAKFGWDGVRSNYYDPPEKVTDKPFLVKTENIVYISAELFTGYGKRAAYQLRQLLGKAIAYLMPELKFTSTTLPSFARAFVQQKGGTELVHILAYCPEKRCEAMALEDRITLMETEFSLRIDNDKQVKSVYLAPDRTPLEWELDGNYCKVKVPRIDGYALIVVE